MHVYSPLFGCGPSLYPLFKWMSIVPFWDMVLLCIYCSNACLQFWDLVQTLENGGSLGRSGSWMCFLRGFSSYQETEKNHMMQDPGSRGGGWGWQSLNVFLGEILLCQLWLVCRCISCHEEVWFHMCMRLVELFVVFVQFRKNTVSVVLPRDALSTLCDFCSTMPFE